MVASSSMLKEKEQKGRMVGGDELQELQLQTQKLNLR
jgi:hypothetical protein